MASGAFSHVAASIETNVLNAQLRIAQFNKTIVIGTDTVTVSRIFDENENATTFPVMDDEHVEIVLDNKIDAGDGYCNIYIKPTSTISVSNVARATAGNPFDLELDAADYNASATYYDNLSVLVYKTIGGLNPQVRQVSSFVPSGGSTPTLTVSVPFDEVIDNTYTYILGSVFYPADYIGTWKVVVNNGGDTTSSSVTIRESLKYSVEAVVASNAGSGVISAKTAANIAGSPSNPLAVSADETYTNDVVATVTITNVVLPIIGSIYATAAGDQEDPDKDKLGVLVADQDQSAHYDATKKSCTFGIEVTGGLAGITSFQEGIEFTFVATDNAGRNITGTMTVDFVPVIDLSLDHYTGHSSLTTHDISFDAATTSSLHRRYVLSENASGVYESKNILELTMTGLESYTQTDFVEGGSVSTGALTDWKAYTADEDVYKIQTPSSGNNPIGTGQEQTVDFTALTYKVGSNGASYVFEYDVFQVLFNNVGDLDADVRTAMLVDDGSTFTAMKLGAFMSARFDEITFPAGAAAYFVNAASADSAGNPALTSAGDSSAILCETILNGLTVAVGGNVTPKIEIQDGQAGGTRISYTSSSIDVTTPNTALTYSSGFSPYDRFDETDNSAVETIKNDFDTVLSDPHGAAYVYTAYHVVTEGNTKCIVDQTITPKNVGATLSTVAAEQGVDTLNGSTGLNDAAPNGTAAELLRVYMSSKSNLYSRVLVPNGYTQVAKSSLHTNATTLALWTRLNMTFEVANSAPINAQTIVHGTQETASGDSGDTAVTLNTAESSTNDAFNGRVLKLNTSPVQYRTITDYVGSTKVATLDSALTTAVSVGSTTYSIAGGAMLGGIITAVGDIMMSQNPTSSVASQFVTGTAQSIPSSTSIQLASGVDAGTYDNWFVEITSGNGVGQIRKLSGGTVATSTVAEWDITPSGTPTYIIHKVPVPQFVGTDAGDSSKYKQVTNHAGTNNTQGMTLIGATDFNVTNNAFDMFTFTNYPIMTLNYEPKVHFTNTARSLASAGTSGGQLAVYRSIAIGGEDGEAGDGTDTDSKLTQPAGRTTLAEYDASSTNTEPLTGSSVVAVTALDQELGKTSTNTFVGHPQLGGTNNQGIVGFGGSDFTVQFTQYISNIAQTPSAWLLSGGSGDYLDVDDVEDPTTLTLNLKNALDDGHLSGDSNDIYMATFRLSGHGGLSVNDKISGGTQLWDDNQILESDEVSANTDIQMFFTYQFVESLIVNLFTPLDTAAYCSKTTGLSMSSTSTSTIGNLLITRSSETLQFEDTAGSAGSIFASNSQEPWVRHSCSFTGLQTAAVPRDTAAAPGNTYAFTNVFHDGDSTKLASISSATYNYTDSNYGSTTGTGAGAVDGLHLTQGVFTQNNVERDDDNFTDAAIVPFINGPEDAFLQIVAHNNSSTSTLKVSANPASAPDVEDKVANAFYIVCQRVSFGNDGTVDRIRPLSLHHSGISSDDGTTNTIVLTTASGVSAVNDYYNNQYIHIVSGTGSGQSRLISGYVGGTKVATVSVNWDTDKEPDATSGYEIGCDANAGTATAGSTTTITLAAGASASAQFYRGAEIQIVDGPCVGDIRTISDYDGSKVATVSVPFSSTPTTASKYIVGAQIRMGDATGGGEEASVGTTPDATQDGDDETFKLNANASATNTDYVGQSLYIVAGTGAGDVRSITGYTGATRVAAISAGTVLDSTSKYAINTTASATGSLESGFRQPANSYYAYSIGLNPSALSMEDLVNDTGDYSAEDPTDTLDYNLNFIVEDAGNSDDRIAQIPLKVQSGGAIQDVALAANNDLSCEGSFAYDLTVTKVGISNTNVVWRLMHTAGDVSTLLDGTTNIYAGAISSRFKRHFQNIDSDNLFEGSGYQGSTALEKILKNIKGGKYRLQMAGDTSFNAAATTDVQEEAAAIATFADLDSSGTSGTEALIATSDVFDTGADHTSTIPYYTDLGTAATGGLRTGLNKNGDKLIRMRGFGWNTSTGAQDANTDADFAPHDTEAKDVVEWKKVAVAHDLSLETLMWT
jgi:hypothetical protein